MNRAERLSDREEATRIALDARQASMWTAVPGILTGVDLVSQTVSVRPAIMGRLQNLDGTSQDVQMPLLVDVPVCWPRSQGFALTLPLKVGDEVLVVFSCRCIDSWWQGGGEGGQAELRMHDLSDGFAIPGPTSQPKKLVNVNENNVQLRDTLGTTYFELRPAGIAGVKAVSEIRLEAPNVNVQGNLNVTGNMTVTGTLTVGGVVFNTHVHGSSPGPSNP
jgi:hypothetical protein